MNDNRAYFVWSYPDQKLSEAIHTLTTSFAPNWQRMEYALFSLLGLIPQHFPDQDLFLRVENLLAEATKRGPLILNESTDVELMHYGGLENTLRKCRKVTFERFADEIVSIHDEIKRRQGEYQE